MEPKIIEKPGFTVVGIRYFGKNEKGEIPALWGDLMKRSGEIKNKSRVMESYGLMGMMDKEGNFEYIACLPVDKVAELPEGMVSRKIDDTKYLVFTHVGDAEKMKKTYDFVYNKYCPDCGKEVRYDTYHFELYDERFKNFAPDSEFDIYVPIK